MNDIEVTWSKISSNKGELTFKSDVEGIATTYANLYRRSLLQSTPSMAVAAIRCEVDGSYSKNLFQMIPGLTDSLIELNSRLHNATFDIDSDSDSFIISMGLKGKVMLSDICDTNKYVVSKGDLNKISLVSEDITLTSVVGNHEILLDIFFKRGSGFSQKDVNTQLLEDLCGNQETDTWIVTDSQHRGVLNVSYHASTRLGKQTIVLGITSFQNNIDEVVNGCTERIIAQLSKITGITDVSVQ